MSMLVRTLCNCCSVLVRAMAVLQARPGLPMVYALGRQILTHACRKDTIEGLKP